MCAASIWGAPEMAAILEVSDLRAGYATGDVLQGVGVAVEQGEVVGVLGRNGVGKSTLMRGVIGLLRARQRHHPLQGRGRDVPERRPAGTPRHGLCPAGPRDLSAHVGAGQSAHGPVRQRRQPAASLLDEVYGYFPFLKERARQRGGTLSGGQQEMLAIAQGARERAGASAARRALGRRPALDRPGDRRLHRRDRRHASRSAF